MILNQSQILGRVNFLPTCAYVGVSALIVYPQAPTCEQELKARKRGGALRQGSSATMRFILAIALLAGTSQVGKLEHFH